MELKRLITTVKKKVMVLSKAPNSAWTLSANAYFPFLYLANKLI